MEESDADAPVFRTTLARRLQFLIFLAGLISALPQFVEIAIRVREGTGIAGGLASRVAEEQLARIGLRLQPAEMIVLLAFVVVTAILLEAWWRTSPNVIENERMVLSPDWLTELIRRRWPEIAFGLLLAVNIQLGTMRGQHLLLIGAFACYVILAGPHRRVHVDG